jgi:hypothetical protein
MHRIPFTASLLLALLLSASLHARPNIILIMADDEC